MRRVLAVSFLCAMSLHLAVTSVFAQVPEGPGEPPAENPQASSQPGTAPGTGPSETGKSSAPTPEEGTGPAPEEEPGPPGEETGPTGEEASSSAHQRSSIRVPIEPPASSSVSMVVSSRGQVSSIAVFHSSSVRPAQQLPVGGSVRASSSVASSVISSQASSVADSSASSMDGIGAGSFWGREHFGYSVPLIDPHVVATPGRLSWVAVPGNLWLALLFTIVVGWSGVVFAWASRRQISHMPLSLRLGIPALLTMLIITVVEWLIPQASAQGTDGLLATASFLRLPGYAFIFFVLMGIVDSYYASLRSMPLKAFDRWLKKYIGKEELHKATWFLLLLILLFSIVSSYRNQAFHLLPSAQLGIILVTLLVLILKTYSVDIFKLVVVRRWKYPSWFIANLGGVIFAAVCVFLTREFQLNPGFMYGAPLGLYLLVQDHRKEAVLHSTSMWWALAVAGVVWSILPFVEPYPVLYDALLAVPFVLIEGLFFELIPIPSMYGGTIFRWRKLLWAVQFFVVTFLLFQFIFRSGESVGAIQQSPPTLFMLIGLGCYAVGTVCLWLYVKARKGR